LISVRIAATTHSATAALCAVRALQTTTPGRSDDRGQRLRDFESRHARQGRRHLAPEPVRGHEEADVREFTIGQAPGPEREHPQLVARSKIAREPRAQGHARSHFPQSLLRTHIT